MTLKKLFVLLLIGLSFQAFSQETLVTKDGKTYPATQTWNFICENYALTGKAAFQIAKTDKGGLLKLTVETTDSTFYIGGVVYVYLEDNTVLVCTDKGMRQTADTSVTSFYNFSAIEMNRLKKTNITSIRFNIKGTPKKFSSQVGNFTAVNKKAYFSTSEIKPGTFETASEINSLYQ